MSQETPSEARLRHQLDVQRHQIERVLSRHRLPATVIGGSVRSRDVLFTVQSQLAQGFERLRLLKDDLLAALGGGEMAVLESDGSWQLRVTQQTDPDVPLLRLLRREPDLFPATAPVGLDDRRRTVLLRFAPGQVSHVLIAGVEGSGKAAMLRTIAAGLAMTNRQSDLQLVLASLREGHSLRGELDALLPIRYLPHLLADVPATTAAEADLLRFLAEETLYRRKERIRTPRIVVLIDRVDEYLQRGGRRASDDLLCLLQQGAVAGVHVVMSTGDPESDLIDVTMRANLPVRLVGRCLSSEQARRAAGTELQEAVLLREAGEFLAVWSDETTYFRMAEVGDYDLHHWLAESRRDAQPRLLAQPFWPAERVRSAESEAERQRSFDFVVQDGAIQMRSSDPGSRVTLEPDLSPAEDDDSDDWEDERPLDE